MSKILWEDLMQSLEAIRLAYAQALIVNREKLEQVREDNDVTTAQEIVAGCLSTDLRPLLQEARVRSGGAIDPIAVYRDLEIRKELIERRGTETVATGL